MDAKSELNQIKARMSELMVNVKASGRELTEAEITEVDRLTTRAFELKAAIDRGERSADLMDHAKGKGNAFETWNGGQPTGDAFQVANVKGRITNAGIKQMAEKAAKALVAAGSSATAVALDETPIRLGVPGANLGILDVIPVTRRDNPSYSYQRQTVRTLNAAVVAPGAQKPTSVLTFETVNNTVSVIAHISEYLDSYVMTDNESLNAFVEAELRLGLFQKLTSLAVAAYAGASGAQTQAFTTNVMDSLYLGASKAQELGYNPDVVLLTRADFDAIVLAKDGQGNYLYRNPEDSRLHGLQPVIATGLAAKTAIVLDSSKVGISVDQQGVLTKWDAISKLDYNQVRALVEMRAGFDTYAPASIVKVGTAA
ncbi:phage major capsid protein [Microbacterium sp. UBA3486]|uniref:phage major capsid protein n=1 Tax=Microbacterium TaxID=33882 RepID=UPI0025F9C9F7|nr:MULTISPECIES: phage major capsid protein [Microbacterium]